MVGLRLAVEMLSFSRVGGDHFQQGHHLALGQRWREGYDRRNSLDRNGRPRTKDDQLRAEKHVGPR
jgi:hypothetical protein